MNAVSPLTEMCHNGSRGGGASAPAAPGAAAAAHAPALPPGAASAPPRRSGTLAGPQALACATDVASTPGDVWASSPARERPWKVQSAASDDEAAALGRCAAAAAVLAAVAALEERMQVPRAPPASPATPPAAEVWGRPRHAPGPLVSREPPPPRALAAALAEVAAAADPEHADGPPGGGRAAAVPPLASGATPPAALPDDDEELPSGAGDAEAVVATTSGTAHAAEPTVSGAGGQPEVPPSLAEATPATLASPRSEAESPSAGMLHGVAAAFALTSTRGKVAVAPLEMPCDDSASHSTAPPLSPAQSASPAEGTQALELLMLGEPPASPVETSADDVESEGESAPEVASEPGEAEAQEEAEKHVEEAAADTDEVAELRKHVRRHEISWPQPTALGMEDHLSRAFDIRLFWFFEARDRLNNSVPELQEQPLEPIHEYPADWPQWRIDSFELREAARAGRAAFTGARFKAGPAAISTTAGARPAGDRSHDCRSVDCHNIGSLRPPGSLGSRVKACKTANGGG